MAGVPNTESGPDSGSTVANTASNAATDTKTNAKTYATTNTESLSKQTAEADSGAKEAISTKGATCAANPKT